MSRANTLLRSRHLLSTSNTTIPTIAIRRSSFATTPITASSLLRRPITRVSVQKSFHRPHDVAAENTKLVWTGSAASIASRLVLQRGLNSPGQRSAKILSNDAQILSGWRPQRRFFSDRKSASDHVRSRENASQTARDHQEHRSQSTPEHVSSTSDSKGILDRLPHLHRPTKEELLAAATGFWQRMRIRFKWGTIRSVRPFTLDEIGAFVSWIFLGHVVWIVIGTTTFVSLGIWAINTVFAQETVAGWVGNYLTKSSGMKIVFENAIVPTWRSGVITFNNVFVSRRPRQSTKKERSVSKGSSTTAAAAAEAAMAGRTGGTVVADSASADDGNYSQFDVTIQTVNVTLSFSKWFNGKGLLRDVEIIGVRGVIDRTNVRPVEGYVDPKSYRHEHDTGDFEIDDFKMSDVLLTVHQPNDFRPFSVSVFNCELPRLRKQWLFYDFMNANNMSGSFDDSLFTVHPRQVHGHTGVTLTPDGRELGDATQWKKHSRLRIDSLNIDHLNRGVEGPFSWIYEGNVDIVADVMIPHDEDGVWRQSWKKSAEAVTEFYERVEASVVASTHPQHQIQNIDPHDAREGPPPLSTISQSDHPQISPHATPLDPERPIILDISCHLNNIRASVPLFTKDLSYVNNALVRPIVAYINSRNGAFIPVHCRVIKELSEFDGSWTIFDSGLLDDLSKEVYGAFARDVEDKGARKRRMRKVGWWGVQVLAQALFVGLAGQLA